VSIDACKVLDTGGLAPSSIFFTVTVVSVLKTLADIVAYLSAPPVNLTLRPFVKVAVASVPAIVKDVVLARVAVVAFTHSVARLDRSVISFTVQIGAAGGSVSVDNARTTV